MTRRRWRWGGLLAATEAFATQRLAPEQIGKDLRRSMDRQTGMPCIALRPSKQEENPVKSQGIARAVLVAWVLAVGTLPAAVQAENRALIIGIGMGYARYNINPIRGPEKDVELAQALAQQLGFTASQIKILREDAATKEAIVRGLQWVNEGVKEGDRALVYYSGHGTEVPTKANAADDGCMAALVPVDTRTGGGRLLLADELNRLLDPLRQRAKVLMLVDACFSGSITKNLYRYEGDQLSKYYDEKSGQRCSDPINKSIEVLEAKATEGQATTDQLVAMTATAHNEIAFGDLTGSGKGSLFTQALVDILGEQRGQETRLTFLDLKDRMAARIKQVAERYGRIRHTPQLRGNSALFQKDLLFAVATPSHPAVAERPDRVSPQALFDQFVRNSRFFVNLDMPQNRKQIPLGAPIAFVVRSGKDGYLNLMELEPDSKTVQVLFPNGYKEDNTVKAYQAIEIPKDIGGFRFKAREPLGKSRILALVTRQPLNLYRQDQGKILGSFKELTAEEYKKAITRSVGIEPETAPVAAEETREFGANEVYLEVVKAP